MNMKFGYARVSKNDQSLDVQLQKLREVGCEEIFQEKVSGAKDERPELQRLIAKIRTGDTVYVVRLDRLGRRMTKLIDLVNEFKEKGVEFVSLENNIDTATPMGMLLFNMCAAFAEMERELIRERVRAGLEIAHRKGRRGGRPKVVTPEKVEMLKTLRESGEFSVSQMCAMAKVSKSGYYRAVGVEGV